MVKARGSPTFWVLMQGRLIYCSHHELLEFYQPKVGIYHHAQLYLAIAGKFGSGKRQHCISTDWAAEPTYNRDVAG